MINQVRDGPEDLSAERKTVLRAGTSQQKVRPPLIFPPRFDLASNIAPPEAELETPLTDEQPPKPEIEEDLPLIPMEDVVDFPSQNKRQLFEEKSPELKLRNARNDFELGLMEYFKSNATLELLENAAFETDLIGADFQQLQLPDTKPNLEFGNPPEVVKEIENGLDKLEKKVAVFVKNRDNYTFVQDPVDMLKVNESKLTEYEMQILRQEYAKPSAEDRNILKLDEIVRRLQFFARYPAGIRMSFLDSTQYLHFEANENIFKQGDEGDQMYIILRGCVNVRVAKPNVFGKEDSTVVACIYDGGHFGELAMMRPGQAAKRAATIEAAESCDMLSLPRDKFKEIVMSQIQKALDSKIRILMSLPFFQYIEAFDLIPMANALTSTIYRYGEVILSPGIVPECVYIVSSGRCKVIHEYTISKPKGMVREGVLNWKQEKPIDKLKRATSHKKVAKKGGQEPADLASMVSFENEIVSAPDSEIVTYKKHLEVARCNKGSIFTLRALKVNINNDGSVDPSENAKVTPTKLTVIADTEQVEILSFDRKQMIFLPLAIQKCLRKGVEDTRDYDEIDVKSLLGNEVSWQGFKEKIVERTIQNIKEKRYNSKRQNGLV